MRHKYSILSTFRGVKWTPYICEHCGLRKHPGNRFQPTFYQHWGLGIVYKSPPCKKVDRNEGNNHLFANKMEQ